MRVEKIELPGAGHGAKIPTLTAYVQDNIEDRAARRRPAALICPGGGYAFCSDREGEPIALALLARGYQAFVLDYTVIDATEAAPLLPAPQIDLARALALVRSRADDWRVDEAHIGLIGCSAGAHLCATYTALARDDAFLAHAGVSAAEARVAWQILCYPVVDLEAGWPPDPAYAARICEEGSPLWHTVVDETVPVRNAYLYAQALAEAGVDHELHVFHEGRHGLSLATEQTSHYAGDALPHLARWLDLALEWVDELTDEK